MRCLWCHKLTLRSRCPECQARYDAPRKAEQAAQRNAGISGWQWQRTRDRIFQRDCSQCQRCGFDATQIDHIIELADGGTHHDDNLRALCTRCHVAKTTEAARLRRARNAKRNDTL